MKNHRNPHVILFPFPLTGHVTPMLQLAELLVLSDVHVTFLITDHAFSHLISVPESPRFVLKTFPDGLPLNHPRFVAKVPEIYDSLNSDETKQLVTEIFVSGEFDCVISDGLFGNLAIGIGDRIGIPVIVFRTFSGVSFLVYFSVLDLIHSGEIPIKGEDDMDRILKSVIGMESILRCRDLPKFCRAKTKEDLFHFTAQETLVVTRAKGLILNTFEDLEGPILSQIRARCNPNTYAIGPLNTHLKERKRLAKKDSTASYHNHDKTCIAWLDSQPPRSVIYVSFGSLVVITKAQLMEFWHGLVNSNQRFLWVMRKDLLAAGEELISLSSERGFVAEWVPQEEVLSHVSVGGFLTHSGWNSTLESIVTGVAMICWPSFGDQQVNSRFVGEVWKLGIDMKDVCDSKVVEKIVNDLMVERRDEFVESTGEMARLAKKSVSLGGSSHCDFERLICDIVSLANKEKL